MRDIGEITEDRASRREEERLYFSTPVSLVQEERHVPAVLANFIVCLRSAGKQPFVEHGGRRFSRQEVFLDSGESN